MREITLSETEHHRIVMIPHIEEYQVQQDQELLFTGKGLDLDMMFCANIAGQLMGGLYQSYYDRAYSFCDPRNSVKSAMDKLVCGTCIILKVKRDSVYIWVFQVIRSCQYQSQLEMAEKLLEQYKQRPDAEGLDKLQNLLIETRKSCI